MIHFNELRFSDDLKYIIIDAEIENLSYYDNIYFTAINIDTDKTYSSNGISSKPIYTNTALFEPVKTDYTVYTKDDGVYVKTITEDDSSDVATEDAGNVYLYKRRFSIRISASDLNLSDLNSNIFFIYISVGGTMDASSIPCGYDSSYELGILYNLRPIYDAGMGYVKALADDCVIDQNFIDYILRLDAFNLSIDTGNFNQAIDYWQKYITQTGSKTSTINTTSKCGCHGFIK